MEREDFEKKFNYCSTIKGLVNVSGVGFKILTDDYQIIDFGEGVYSVLLYVAGCSVSEVELSVITEVS